MSACEHQWRPSVRGLQQCELCPAFGEFSPEAQKVIPKGCDEPGCGELAARLGVYGAWCEVHKAREADCSITAQCG